VGAMAAAAVLVTTARRSSASEHYLDEIPLDGMFAKSLKLVKQLRNRPRSHMPPRVMRITENVKCYFVLFLFFRSARLQRQRRPHDSLRILMRAPIPARAAPGASQIQAFEHQPKLSGVDLDMAVAGSRLHG
jgi:hypothetical protein